MNSIISKRVVNTSIRNVFSAYSNEALLEKWWGPNGFTNRIKNFDFVENGAWDIDMIDENGKEYPNSYIFQVIIPFSKIVANHISKPCYVAEIDFKSVTAHSTEISFKMIFSDEKTYAALRNYVPEKNEENFNRLENILAINFG